eukprot:455048-Pyramimonas_sp.AAC.1
MAEGLDMRLNSFLCGTLPTREQSLLVSHTTGDVTCYAYYLPLVKSYRHPRAQIWAGLDDRGPGPIDIPWTKSHVTAQQRAQHAIDGDGHFLTWCADYFARWTAREGGATSE